MRTQTNKGSARAEKGHFLLVASSLPKLSGGILPASQVTQARLSSRMWPLYASTHNIDRIAANDLCVIYAGGYGTSSRCFVGQAAVAALNVTKGWQEPAAVKNAHTAIKVMELVEEEHWKVPIPIHSLLKSLEFIRMKTYWGTYLQGGVRFIGAADYGRIISAGRDHSGAPSPTD